MPSITNPVVLERGIRADFVAGYQSGTPIYTDLCTTINSNAKDEKYGWLGSTAIMREFVDERLPSGVRDNNQTLVNKKYEATIEVDRDALADDQIASIPIRAQDLGRRARRHPDQLLAALLVSGESTACYDGQYFFDTDHSEGSSGTQDNDLTKTVADTSNLTATEVHSIFNSAVTKMLGYKDDRGQPFLEEWMLDSSNVTIMGAPQHRKAFMEAFNSSLISNTDNVFRGAARPIINSRLTDVTKLYVFYNGAPVRPFIFQDREPVEFSSNVDGDTAFMKEKYYFGVRARYVMGFGLWQYAVLTTTST